MIEMVRSAFNLETHSLMSSSVDLIILISKVCYKDKKYLLNLKQYQCGEPFNKATSDDAPWTKAKASGVN